MAPALLLRGTSGEALGDELVLGLGTGLGRGGSCWPVSFPVSFRFSCCEVEASVGTKGGAVLSAAAGRLQGSRVAIVEGRGGEGRGGEGRGGEGRGGEGRGGEGREGGRGREREGKKGGTGEGRVFYNSWQFCYSV